MKKSFMTRVLAVSLSAAMAFSMSSANNLMTASAASTVKLKTTFKTLKVKQTYQLKLTNNTLNWKISKVTTSNKSICTVYDKKASSVMLKGKGVGRAKIKVTVKTTKRKTNNTKTMTCTANVKAADTPVNPPVVDTLSVTATAISKGQVRVAFNKAVDDANDASLFTVSDGVTVTKAEQDEARMSTVLTIDGAESGKSYDLTVSGVKVNGEVQPNQTTKFTTPADDVVNTGYDLKITSDPEIVKCDGQTQAKVTFELTKDGKPVTDQKTQVEFNTSIGTFATTRATLIDGKATVQYNAPQLNAGASAIVYATVVESGVTDLIGTKGTGTITLNPNPDQLVNEAAIITSAAAGTADRVIAYFDKEVNAADFMDGDAPNFDKFECEIRSGIDVTGTGIGTPHTVVAVLPVDGQPNALELLVNYPMVDNSNVSVKFKDKRASNTIDTTNTVHFRLADAREPSALNVTSDGTREIKITFSEAVLGYGTENERKTHQFGNRYSALNPANYLIDGKSLTDYWGVEVGGYDQDTEAASSTNDALDRVEKHVVSEENVNAKDGSVIVHAYSAKDGDRRNQVTIRVGSGSVLSEGTHTLTVANVGDWAAKTDSARNIVNTQLFTFNVAANNDKPEFTVEVQSPEQYLLDFNKEFRVIDDENFTTENSAGGNSDVERTSVLKLQEYINGDWKDITDEATGNGKNPVRITRIDNTDKYLVEVMRDWSEVYQTESTGVSYNSKRLRLHVDAGKLVNVANNLKNDVINIELNSRDAKVTNGAIMESYDLTSPKIIVDSIKRATAGGKEVDSWNVEFTEPVKISNENNLEGLTPSESQRKSIGQSGNTENQGVPVPVAEFINVANPTIRVQGDVDKKFIDAEDKIINISPISTLTPGDWRLSIASVSDDYGNTVETNGNIINIPEVSVTSNFKIVWAGVSNTLDFNGEGLCNDTGYGSFVFVKFSKPVDRVTALDPTNYSLENAPLPQGSRIEANIKGYDDHDNVLDSVTIVLPTSSTGMYNNYTVSGKSTVLSINGVLASGTGELLSNGGMNTMPYNIGEGFDSNTYKDQNTWPTDKGATPNETGNKILPMVLRDWENDAIWGNATSEKADASKYSDNIKGYYTDLKKALEDDKYRKVIITKDIFTGNENSEEYKAAIEVFGKDKVLKINRAVDINLSGKTIKGNVEVNTTDAVGTMTIENGVITGEVGNSNTNKATLKVNAGSVKDFILDGVRVEAGDNDERAIILNNVWANSFVTNANSTICGDIIVTDTDGFGFENSATWTNKDENDRPNLQIDSNGEINLKGDFTGKKIYVNRAATLNLDKANMDSNTYVGIFMAETKLSLEGMLYETMPVIQVAGENVKVYFGKTPNQMEGVVTVVGKGSVIQTTEKYKELSANSTDRVTIPVGGLRGAFEAVDVFKVLGTVCTNDVSGVKDSDTYKVRITSGSSINVSNIVAEFKNEMFDGAGFVYGDKGEEILRDQEGLSITSTGDEILKDVGDNAEVILRYVPYDKTNNPYKFSRKIKIEAIK